jgi:MFS family permease
MSALPALPSITGRALDRARVRIRASLFLGVALGSTGHIAAVTVGTLAAKDLLGDPTLAGLPSSGVVLGAALGAVVLSQLMAVRGRRLGITLGYLVGLSGAVVATLAVVSRSFPLLMVGTALIGFGNSSNQLSRYAAADLVASDRRATAIGLVVWGSTVGSVVGPWLVPIAGAWAVSVGLPQLAGPYFVPMAFVTLAAAFSFAMLRPDPFQIAHHSAVVPEARPDDPDAVPLRVVLRRPVVMAAVVALVAAQFTMTLIMTMTPLHMTSHGHGLDAVGLVLSAHTAGMFALSPVSGWLARRLGLVRAIVLGVGVLSVAAVMAAFAPDDGGVILTLALFLLGFGWSIGFVSGSALLSSGLELGERTRVQGAADAIIWGTAAVASAGSGVIVAEVGYTWLGILGLAVVVASAWVVASSRRAIANAADAPLPVTPSSEMADALEPVEV